MYVSGPFAFDPKPREKKFGPIEEETRQALRNVESNVNEAGSSKGEILRMTLYIPEAELWDTVDGVYKEFFGNRKPVRTCRIEKRITFWI